MMSAVRQQLQRENPAGGPGLNSAGVSRLRSNDAQHIERLQLRLSTFALALDAVLPDIAFLENAVQLSALGMPLPAGGQVRLHKLALKLFDLRVVLDAEMPQ